MIRLDLKREPHWLDLGHGVRLYVRPLTTALMMAARAAVQHTAAASTASEATGLRSAELLKGLARLAVLDWEGIGDAAGDAAPVTPERVDALMDLWPIASAFENTYLGPALLLDEEKNAFGLVPNGTSVAGPSTAAAAPGLAGCAPEKNPAAMGSSAPISSTNR